MTNWSEIFKKLWVSDQPPAVVLASTNVDGICAGQIVTRFMDCCFDKFQSFVVTSLHEVLDVVKRIQKKEPRGMILVNCGGSAAELAALDLEEDSFALVVDCNREVPREVPEQVEIARFKGKFAPASLIALDMLNAKRLQTEEVLWRSIVGVTGRVLEGGVNAEESKWWMDRLNDEVVARASDKITTLQKMPDLPFLRFTNLWEAMNVCGELMAKTHAWRDRESEEIKKMLVDLEVPIEESKWNYNGFMLQHEENFNERLENAGATRGLHELIVKGFVLTAPPHGSVSSLDHARAIDAVLVKGWGPSLSARLKAICKANVAVCQMKAVHAAVAEFRSQSQQLFDVGVLFEGRAKKQRLVTKALPEIKQLNLDCWRNPLLLEKAVDHAKHHLKTKQAILLSGKPTDDNLVPVAAARKDDQTGGIESAMENAAMETVDEEHTQIQHVGFKSNVLMVPTGVLGKFKRNLKRKLNEVE